MILKQSRLKIIDNSGAKSIKVFHLFGYSSTQNYSKVGDLVLGSITQFKANKKVEKRQLCKVLIVTTKKFTFRQNGNFIRFDENRGVVVSDAKKILGTRVFGPVASEVKKGQYARLASMARKVL